jgi:hypothetical protein
MKSLLNTKSKVQSLQNQWQNQSFINSLTLNFTTMKKQVILILLAVFASITVVFGQGALPGSAPRPFIDCETGPLNPIAGVPYDYSAFVDPHLGTAYWFATFNNTTFIENGVLTDEQEAVGGDFIYSATNYQNDVPGASD